MNDIQRYFSDYINEWKGLVFTDEPLKNHCTFKIGGPAEILFVPQNEKALIAAVKFANLYGVPLRVLGNGSNVLISDKGLKGITIKLMGGLTDLMYLGDGMIACGAGVSLKKLCTFALENELTGLEFAYGIPGSVGGAIYMNGGAYGGEIKTVLTAVRSVSLKDGSVKETPVSELDMSYRHTAFMTNGEIITAGYFKLEKGDKTEIEAKMSELLGKRKASQPLEYPSAGSTFKRPPEGYAAAHIEQCGLKGHSHGGAMVSPKHAGFVINTGNASFDDVIAIMDEIKQTVFEQHGVMLEPEVEILGDD